MTTSAGVVREETHEWTEREVGGGGTKNSAGNTKRLTSLGLTRLRPRPPNGGPVWSKKWLKDEG